MSFPIDFPAGSDSSRSLKRPPRGITLGIFQDFKTSLTVRIVRSVIDLISAANQCQGLDGLNRVTFLDSILTAYHHE